MIQCPKCRREWDDATSYCGECGTRLDKTGAERDALVDTIFHNRYRVLERIASGGFGTIYKIQHLQLGSIRALKLLHQWVANDETQIERFRREAALLDRIRGATEHVPTNYTFDRDDERRQWYFTMEYLDGVSLNQELLQNGKMGSERAVDLMRQICAALRVVHELNVPELGRVTHRDLKPHNIMLVPRDGKETVKVLDFGIAKAEAQPGLTAVGTGPGSPGYMSPEQLAGKVDPRTDLFSAGVCFYNMVTACDPWLGKPYGEPTGETGDTLNTRVKTQPPIPPRKLEPSVPPAVEAVILKLLAKSAEERFQSAAELDADLERIQLGLGVPGGGKLRVRSMPAGANVVVKRGAATVYVGRTPCEVGPLTPGAYEIQVRKKNCGPATGRVKVEPNDTTDVEFPLTRVASPREKLAAAVSARMDSLPRGRRKERAAARRKSERNRWRLVITAAVGLSGIGLLTLWGVGAFSRASPGITIAELQQYIEANQVTGLRVDTTGQIQASLRGGATINVRRDGERLFESLLPARQAGIRIRSNGSTRLTAILDWNVGSNPPIVSICSDDGTCKALAFDARQTLAAGWYTLKGEAGDWTLESVSVDAEFRGLPSEQYELSSETEEFFLAGGSETRLTLFVRGVIERRADSLYAEVIDHVEASRLDSAEAALSEIDRIAPEYQRGGRAREQVSDAYLDEARRLRAESPQQALQSLRSCLRVLPGNGDCVSLQEQVNADLELARQVREREQMAEAERRRQQASSAGDTAVTTVNPPDRVTALEQPPTEELLAVEGDWLLVDDVPEARCPRLIQDTLTIARDQSALSGGGAFLSTCDDGARTEIRITLSPLSRVGSNDIVIITPRGDDVCTYRANPIEALGEISGAVECESGARGSWMMRPLVRVQ